MDTGQGVVLAYHFTRYLSALAAFEFGGVEGLVFGALVGKVWLPCNDRH